MTLKYKHLNDRIRLTHLDVAAFPAIPDMVKKPKQYKFAAFAILTRFPNGMIGAYIPYVENRGCNKWFGEFMPENSKAETFNAWIKEHTENPNFKSVEDVIKEAKN